MLCFSLKKKSTIFFRTVSSWTPEYYVLRETTEVRLYSIGLFPGCQYIKCIFRGKIEKDCGIQTQEHDPEVSGAFAEKNFRPARRKNGKRRDRSWNSGKKAYTPTWQWRKGKASRAPFSVVVLGKFRHFLLQIPVWRDLRFLLWKVRLTDPFSVVVLGKFRRFLLVIFLSLFLHLDFSFIYSKFSMPFWGFFY